MGKKIIVFDAPHGLIVLLGGLKRVLDGLALLGAGGVAVESKFQFVPWATLSFLIGRIFIGYIIEVFINQEITNEDK